MKYKGGKQMLGKHLAKFIKESTINLDVEGYLEPFCGSLGVLIHMTDTFDCTAADYHPDLIEMWKAVQDNSFKPPVKVSEEDYLKIKQTSSPSALKGFVGFGCSFGGQFFGGYAQKYANGKKEDFLKGATHSINKKRPVIKDVDFSMYDFVAFADQDDIWLSEKLCHGIQAMKSSGSKAYSSDVMAFWPNGQQKLIKKSYTQKRFDFIFESAGPGCTYIFHVEPFLDFKKFITSHWERVLEVEFHDWMAYSFFRSKGYKWLIDDNPTMLYRQHENNQFGANSSWTAYVSRLRLIAEGWYANQTRLITMLLDIPPVSKRFIILNFMQTRRKKLDSFSMLIFSLFFKK